MQVPEEQSDVVRWATVPESQAISDLHARVRGASTPARFSTEYAHIGPLDHGYDGHASSKENARLAAQKHSAITRKPVGASHHDTRLTAGQDRQHAAQRSHGESREHVSVVPTLTFKQEKRFGLADPKVASTVSRTLSQLQRLSDVVTPEQSERSAVLAEAPARSRSQQKKIDRFTRELQRYKSVHPKPPDSTPPEPPSRDSLRTVSALVPYHGEFKEAGLAVTSAEQMRRFSARRPDCRAANLGAVPAQMSSSTTRHVGKDAVRGPGAGLLPGPSADRSLGRPCSIQRTPPGGIAGLAADPAPVTPTSPSMILPWLCEKQTESLPATDREPTSAGPIKGPETPVARVAARVSIREPRKTPMVAYVETETRTSSPAQDHTEPHDRISARANHGERGAENGLPPRTEPQRQDDTRWNTSSRRVSRILAAIRSQPTTIPEETGILDADRTTFDVNKPLPKTPGEAEPSRAGAGAGRYHGEDRASDTAAAVSSATKKVAPSSAPLRADDDRSRGGASSSPPTREANAWKYATVTDSSLEKALDGVISKLRELDDANRRLACECEEEKTEEDARKISNTGGKEPAPVAGHHEGGQGRDVGASSSRQQPPLPARIGDGTSAATQEPLPSPSPPPPPPKEDVHRGAERKRPAATGPPPGQMGRPGDDEGGESEWEDEAAEDEGEQPPPPPRQRKNKNEQAPADHHDRDISDRDVLKGLRLALAAACDEDYDAWIRGRTGLRLRRFMADLKGFEDFERKAARARDDQPAWRRRAEQRRQEAVRRSRRMSNHWRGLLFLSLFGGTG